MKSKITKILNLRSELQKQIQHNTAIMHRAENRIHILEEQVENTNEKLYHLLKQCHEEQYNKNIVSVHIPQAKRIENAYKNDTRKGDRRILTTKIKYHRRA